MLFINSPGGCTFKTDMELIQVVDETSNSLSPSSLARWAVRVAYLSIAGFAIGAAIVLITYLSDSSSDYRFGLMFLASWPLSLAAFLLAVVAKVKKQATKLLVLPLWLFPTFTLLWLLGEFTIFE